MWYERGRRRRSRVWLTLTARPPPSNMHIYFTFHIASVFLQKRLVHRSLHSQLAPFLLLPLAIRREEHKLPTLSFKSHGKSCQNSDLSLKKIHYNSICNKEAFKRNQARWNFFTRHLLFFFTFSLVHSLDFFCLLAFTSFPSSQKIYTHSFLVQIKKMKPDGCLLMMDYGFSNRPLACFFCVGELSLDDDASEQTSVFQDGMCFQLIFCVKTNLSKRRRLPGEEL